MISNIPSMAFLLIYTIHTVKTFDILFKEFYLFGPFNLVKMSIHSQDKELL